MFFFKETPKYNHTLKIVYKSGNIERVRCQSWEVTCGPDTEIQSLVISGGDRKKVYWGLNNIESIWEE